MTETALTLKQQGQVIRRGLPDRDKRADAIYRFLIESWVASQELTVTCSMDRIVEYLDAMRSQRMMDLIEHTSTDIMPFEMKIEFAKAVSGIDKFWGYLTGEVVAGDKTTRFIALGYVFNEMMGYILESLGVEVVEPEIVPPPELPPDDQPVLTGSESQGEALPEPESAPLPEDWTDATQPEPHE